jgi:MOSC domain-containing protein YiiM
LKIVSLNIGNVRDLVSPDGRAFRSSIARTPVDGPIRLEIDGFAGDACEYKGHHGPYMTVNAFCLEKYQAFEADEGTKLAVPSCGENLTIEGYPEEEARPRDVIRLGEAILEITQPREPCANIALFTGSKTILKWMNRNAITGYYLKVVEPGPIDKDPTVELVRKADHPWTITKLTELLRDDYSNGALVHEALSLPDLSPRWKKSLEKMHARAVAKA